MVKKVSFNCQQSPTIDEEARIRHRHQSLLQDYLELQKEFVSKKKKLKTAQEKRETLMAEVRFLRLRQEYLLKVRPSETETEAGIFGHQNPNVKPEISTKKRNSYNANNESVNIDTRVSNANRVSESVKGKEAFGEAIRIQKKPKNCLINGKRVGKQKISVQDQVVLEV